MLYTKEFEEAINSGWGEYSIKFPKGRRADIKRDFIRGLKKMWQEMGLRPYYLPEHHKLAISESQIGSKGYWYGKKFSDETRKKMSENAGNGWGEENSNWKGDAVQYKGIHSWLERNYGKERICEGEDCRNTERLDKVRRFDWALKPGCEYERKRENFLRLCRSCHVRMDRNYLGK